MTQLRLDKVQFASAIDTYLNYDTLTANIVVSGSVADGATGVFSVGIPYNRTKTRSDLYARNTTTGIKRPLSGGARLNPYTFVSFETASLSATYNGTDIAVVLAVFNGTGAPITLTNQTLEITAVLYEVPYVQ